MSEKLSGGIDLGGTKMAAQIFDADWQVVFAHEQPTPRDSYEAFLDALGGQVQLLRDTGAQVVGIGTPGIVTREGVLLAANLVATGKPLPTDISARCGGELPFLKDCRAFTLSEAHLGAGRVAASVFGLIMGTGLSGAFVANGELPASPSGMAGELGHSPLPYDLMTRLGLPLLPCGCGRVGCFETLCSGPGISRLAELILGTRVAAEDLSGEDGEQVLDIWAQITARLLDVIVLAHDPEMIVLGGGVSQMEGIEVRLGEALREIALADRIPHIRLAEGGAQSGARGAALFAAMR